MGLLLERRGAVIDGVGGGMDLAPLLFLALVNVDIVLFLGDILDASEHEEVALVVYHRVTASWLSKKGITSGVSLLSTLAHFFYFRLKLHISFRVFTPFVPPKISKFPLYSTMAKLDLPCGSCSFFCPL